MRFTIKDLLNKFELDLELPEPVLDIEIEDIYISYYVNEPDEEEFEYDKSYIFKSEEGHVVIIYPDTDERSILKIGCMPEDGPFCGGLYDDEGWLFGNA